MEKQIKVNLPEKIKILGISGSPRKNGNTASMVKYTLQQAESMGYVETEYQTLADYDFKPCTGCMRCFGANCPADDPYLCYDHPGDGIEHLAPKVAECDGLLLGYPIYSGGEPGLFRIFMEKMTHFGPMSFNKHANGLKYRALGIIAQGGQVYGFQETCFMHTSALGSVLGMYVTNAWPTVDAPMPSSTFFGGILTCVDGDTIYGNNAWKKEATRTVPPASGSRNERSLKNLGWHLAESSMVMKLGRDIFRQAGYKETVAMPFTKYSVKPKPGSYLDKLIKEGKVEFISQEQIKERKQKR